MKEKAKEVFISYSTKDTDIANALLEVLESYGLNCWMAPRNIPKGAQWAEEIDKAIQNARVFVVIISSHSVESKQVPKEIALAVTACESIYPFRIDDTGLQGTFRYYLSDYQFTDATSDAKQKMTELAETICSSLGKPIPKKEPEKKAISEEKPEPSVSSALQMTPQSPQTPQMPQSPQTPQSLQTPQSPQPKSQKPLMIGVVAAIAVIAVILGVVLSGKNKKSNDTESSAVVAVQENTAEVNSETESPEAESPAVEESPEAEGPVVEESPETESPVTESTSEVASAQNPSVQNNSTNTFGVWKLIAYEDRGAATQINTDDLFILGDGTPYFSLEDGLSGSSESALASYLSLQDSSKYNLTVDTSFEDTFDGSISKKTGLSISATYVMQNIVVGYKAPEENPTGLTYDDCYPEQYYFVHLTGSFQESPVKKSDVDTWIVYKKQSSLFSERIFPALAGEWKDNMGNLWEFSVKDDKLAFKMTDVDGNIYNGVNYTHLSADKEKVNFFERLRFEFDEYQTDFYALLSFDGQKLEMLDWNWNSFELTKVK